MVRNQIKVGFEMSDELALEYDDSVFPPKGEILTVSVNPYTHMVYVKMDADIISNVIVDEAICMLNKSLFEINGEEAIML